MCSYLWRELGYDYSVNRLQFDGIKKLPIFMPKIRTIQARKYERYLWIQSKPLHAWFSVFVFLFFYEFWAKKEEKTKQLFIDYQTTAQQLTTTFKQPNNNNSLRLNLIAFQEAKEFSLFCFICTIISTV